MRDDQRNYIVVGVFVIAMVAGLVLWIALVSGRTGSTNPYFIRYNNVLGLSEGTQIYFDGYPIGLIDSIAPQTDGDDQRFRLDVSIGRDWKIPDDSVAEITASGLLSAVVINIRGGKSSTFLDPGDQIASIEAANLMAVMTEAATGISDFLLETVKPEIQKIVADLHRTMDQVNTLLGSENADRIAAILENVQEATAEAKNVVVGLEGSRQNVDGLLANVDGVVANVDQAVAQVNALIAENEGNMSRSIEDLHESLEALARHSDAIASNLEAMTRNMNEFSKQIRQDPGVILRGRSTGDEPTEAKR